MPGTPVRADSILGRSRSMRGARSGTPAEMNGSLSGQKWLLPPIEQWPHRPLLLRFSPTQKLLHCSHDPSCMAINPTERVKFETELFRGEVVVRVRDCRPGRDCDDPWAPGHPSGFSAKKRAFVMTFQGQFKEDVSFADVLSGFQCQRPLKLSRLATLATKMIKSFHSIISEDITGDKPYVLEPLCAACDAANKCAADDARRPDILAGQPEETLGPWKTVKERRKAMKSEAERKRHHYEKGVTYTFGFHSDKFIFTEFRAKLLYGMGSMYFPDYLSGQGFPFLAKTVDGRVIWHVELWHEGLLQDTPPYMTVRGEGPSPAVRRQSRAPWSERRRPSSQHDEILTRLPSGSAHPARTPRRRLSCATPRGADLQSLTESVAELREAGRRQRMEVERMLANGPHSPRRPRSAAESEFLAVAGRAIDEACDRELAELQKPAGPNPQAFIRGRTQAFVKEVCFRLMKARVDPAHHRLVPT
eukprot:TRINITY_DN7703_c0_g1_i1.p1 TRINITY_DN7703_c0_g1~~TRINITY_DN7703_c0_g1_i1.p1  ORF type:complete len:495 (+),score=159.07 TRINITY_DN7703_c0_g1_i1:62-1486(+)